jgi:hypothetical protein
VPSKAHESRFASDKPASKCGANVLATGREIHCLHKQLNSRSDRVNQ